MKLVGEANTCLSVFGLISILSVCRDSYLERQRVSQQSVLIFHGGSCYLGITQPIFVAKTLLYTFSVENINVMI